MNIDGHNDRIFSYLIFSLGLMKLFFFSNINTMDHLNRSGLSRARGPNAEGTAVFQDFYILSSEPVVPKIPANFEDNYVLSSEPPKWKKKEEDSLTKNPPTNLSNFGGNHSKKRSNLLIIPQKSTTKNKDRIKSSPSSERQISLSAVLSNPNDYSKDIIKKKIALMTKKSDPFFGLFLKGLSERYRISVTDPRIFAWCIILSPINGLTKKETLVAIKLHEADPNNIFFKILESPLKWSNQNHFKEIRKKKVSDDLL